MQIIFLAEQRGTEHIPMPSIPMRNIIPATVKTIIPAGMNGIPASVELVEEMAREAKKLIILNPEERMKWDIVDSCVSLYEEAGAQVFEVNTLNQLAHFVEQM